MGEEQNWSSVPPAPMVMDLERPEQWKHFDNSVNAVSFGFVATAILISMFLVMAICERFLRPTSSSSSSSSPPTSDLESPVRLFHSKLRFPSPKMTIYAKGVTVLMPGEDIPTFLAHPAPAPAPCPLEPIIKPFASHNPNCLTSNLP